MYVVIFTALLVGGATIIGALIGFLFEKFTCRFSSLLSSFAAGMMLAASVTGLLIPALEGGTVLSLPVCALGVFAGALFLDVLDRFLPLFQKKTPEQGMGEYGRLLLPVLAIAVHNLPEGIAAGVGFGRGEYGAAVLIAGSIALQNIPEGMVVIDPMMRAGFSKKKTLFYAFLTGVLEIMGTFIGYFSVNVMESLLPFALCFAAGTMLYVIGDEMIPRSQRPGRNKKATYALLVGVFVMLAGGSLL